jgi:hypothetical protein
MARDLKELIREAIELSESDRATLAGVMLESLDPRPTPEIKAAWSREIERRVREIDDGAVELLDWPGCPSGTLRQRTRLLASSQLRTTVKRHRMPDHVLEVRTESSCLYRSRQPRQATRTEPSSSCTALGEHSGRYAHVTKLLGESGWSVAAYDQRGHGRSSGKRGVLARPAALLEDLSEVVDFVSANAPGSAAFCSAADR